jgi:hypothetical protein
METGASSKFGQLMKSGHTLILRSVNPVRRRSFGHRVGAGGAAMALKGIDGYDDAGR